MAAPYSTTGGYDTPVINPDGSARVESAAGTPVLAPKLNPDGTLSQQFIDMTLQGAGYPPLNAILVECLTRSCISNSERRNSIWNRCELTKYGISRHRPACCNAAA